MVRSAIDELGETATADQITHFVALRFQTEIAAKFVPLYRATMRAEAELVRARARAAAILASDEAARKAGKTRTRRTTRTPDRVGEQPRPGRRRSGG